MSAAAKMSAQQKRFEQILKRPENRECFDCSSKQPRWASTNLGIFFCLRCAGIHRSLGTHITKVKSTTMDAWDEDMIDCCDRIGNGNAKDLYEARIPPGYRKPESTAETSAVERLIRQKFEQKLYYAPDCEQLKQRLLLVVPRENAPTPVLSSPVAQLAPPVVTPTFSYGAPSPSSPSPPDWSAFHSSPVAPNSTHGAAAGPQVRGSEDWGHFTSATPVSAPAASGNALTSFFDNLPASSPHVPQTAPTVSPPAAVTTKVSSIDHFFGIPSQGSGGSADTAGSTSSDLLDFGSTQKSGATGSNNSAQVSTAEIMSLFETNAALKPQQQSTGPGSALGPRPVVWGPPVTNPTSSNTGGFPF